MVTQGQQSTSAAWDSIAAGYDQYLTPRHLSLSKHAIERGGIRPGERFLDVAAGSGALSIPAARLGAEVLAIDISPIMVERLKARAATEGLTNLQAQVMDGHALDLDDDTFDLAGSQFGIMLFPDLPLGLRELVRVTKPGGRAFIVAFGPPQKAEFIAYFLRAIQTAVPEFEGFPTDPPPLPFQVSHPDKLREALMDAGLKDVDLETVSHDMEFESASEMWDTVVASNPIGTGIAAGLTEDKRDAARQVLDGMLRERAGGSGPAVLNSEVNIAIGTK